MVEPSDVHAALEARRELGPAYEDQIVDAIVEKIERRLATRKAPEAAPHQGMVTPLVLGSIGLGIPVTAVALSNAPGAGGIAVAIVAWVAIGVANLAAMLRRR
ncbi:MAG TPA: hypothetical protein VM690_04685 [Gaiellaceae bacterium]|nr:hypothetical protein [Gaiellaceae bacterium]